MSVQSIFPDPERRRGSRDYAGPVLELFHENEVNPYNVEYNSQICEIKKRDSFYGSLYTGNLHVLWKENPANVI
jgi:hypothetical protein